MKTEVIPKSLANLSARSFSSLLYPPLCKFEDRPNFFYLHSFFQCLKIIYKLPKNFYFVDFWQPNFSCFLLQSLMILKGGKRIFLDVGGFPVTRNATWKMFSDGSSKTLSD